MRRPGSTAPSASRKGWPLPAGADRFAAQARGERERRRLGPLGLPTSIHRQCDLVLDRLMAPLRLAAQPLAVVVEGDVIALELLIGGRDGCRGLGDQLVQLGEPGGEAGAALENAACVAGIGPAALQGAAGGAL